MKDLLSRPTLLKRCLLAITLPVSKDRFFYELEDANSKDFVKGFEKKQKIDTQGLHPKKINPWDKYLWDTYERNVVKTIRKVQSDAEKSGVCVITDFSISNMNLMKDFDVVTIVGHWLESCKKIELADDIYSIMEFINAIPQNTECILDLTVCHSVILLDEIKKYFKDIIVFGYITQVDVRVSLLKYRCIIHEINQNNLNYFDATALVNKNILKRSK